MASLCDRMNFSSVSGSISRICGDDAIVVLIVGTEDPFARCLFCFRSCWLTTKNSSGRPWLSYYCVRGGRGVSTTKMDDRSFVDKNIQSTI